MSRADPSVPPLAALAVAVLAVGTSAVLVRWSAAPSVVAAFYRVLFTTLFVLPVAAVRHRDAFARFSRRDALVAVASGVALAVHFAAWFESLGHTSVAASVTLVQTQPAFVAVGAWFLLDDRVTRRSVAGIALALCGAAATSLAPALLGASAGVGAGPTPDAALGDALALLGAVAAAGYVLAGRSLRRRLALVPYVTVVYAVCAVCLLAVSLAGARPLVGYPPREWALFLAMAVGPGLFGHTAVNWTLGHLDSHVVSVALLGEPLVSATLAAFLLSELPTPSTLVGGAVVLVGVAVTVSAGRVSGV